MQFLQIIQYDIEAICDWWNIKMMQSVTDAICDWCNTWLMQPMIRAKFHSQI